MPTGYSVVDMAWVALAIFLMGMNKGGFPIGSIALPILVLIWPDQSHAARSAIAFILPLLCVMDVVALAFYRRHIMWKRIVPLLPGTLAGVVVGSVLFVSAESAPLALSERALKLSIGLLGLLFVLYRAGQRWILRRLGEATRPGWKRGSVFGVGAGITSTLAHAAGPLMQMYLLPQQLPKLAFAATTAAFFFLLNLVKLVPFALYGRIAAENLRLACFVVPVIPIGVAAGYLLVRVLKPRHYVGFIYSILFVTSVMLIWGAAR